MGVGDENQQQFLDENIIQPESKQAIITSDEFSSESYCLLQLNDDIEAEILAGKTLFLVGKKDQKAVLCTEEKSFYVTKEDQSNLRLLTTHTTWQKDAKNIEIKVEGSANFHFLLQPKKADASHLKALLMESPFDQSSTNSSEKNPPKRQKLNKRYNTQELVEAIQTSELEVKDMLTQIYAFEEDGYWRILHPSYQLQVFGDMLDSIVQNDWDFITEGISLDQFEAEIRQPAIVIRQCTSIYGSISDSICRLDPAKVAVFCAKKLFLEQNAKEKEEGWNMEQFLETWQLRVPEKVTVDPSMLEGLALTKPTRTKEKRLVYFPEEELPSEPKARFNQLFQVQEKWTEAQLKPYIRALVGESVTQGVLLLKYTRCSRQGNSSERLYSRR